MGTARRFYQNGGLARKGGLNLWKNISRRKKCSNILRKTDGSEKPCVHRNMRIFQRGDDRTAIPAAFTVKGYDNAILDVVNYVAAIENKTAVEIVADIENAVSKNS